MSVSTIWRRCVDGSIPAVRLAITSHDKINTWVGNDVHILNSCMHSTRNHYGIWQMFSQSLNSYMQSFFILC